jgi:uncharacterized protein (TIGR02452 family)
MTKEERKIIAENHFKEMQLPIVKGLTEHSVKNSIIYSDLIHYDNDIEVIDSTTENAIFKYNKGTIPCALNFASFTRPGGGFIKGSFAQEEALCHVSNLYNVLLAFKDHYDNNYKKISFTSGLYDNWAIYSPGIYFKVVDFEAYANVITCAAPNYTVYKEKSDNDTLYDEVLRSRIKYILDIARDNEQKILILGAFGCGVFGNDPIKVATMFKSLLRNYKFEKVIFAIPHTNNGNYEAFKKVFDE